MAQKRIIVGQIGADGATVSDVARRHGMHANLLFRWRRELSSTGPGTGPGAPPAPPVFVPVSLASVLAPVLASPLEPPVPPPVPPPSAELRPGWVEVVVAGGRVVRVGADVDTAMLMRIVIALENGALENGALEDGR